MTTTAPTRLQRAMADVCLSCTVCRHARARQRGFPFWLVRRDTVIAAVFSRSGDRRSLRGRVRRGAAGAAGAPARRLRLTERMDKRYNSDLVACNKREPARAGRRAEPQANVHHARLFLAFDLEEQVCTRLLAVKPALERLLPAARWCRREALHLTVKFFGTLPLMMVSDIARAVQAALAGHAPFRCTLEGLGGFPNLLLPRVLWAGVGDGHAQVCAVADDLLQALDVCGFGCAARGFTPHVTLARLAHRTAVAEAALTRALPDAAHAQFGATAFAFVSLYASELTPAGPRYTLVRQWPLPGA